MIERTVTNMGNKIETEMQNKTQDKKTAAPKAQTVKEVTMLKQATGLFGGHVGGIIIALILCFSLASLMMNPWGLVLAQVLIILAFSIPVYSTMWEYGHKDKNRSNYGHITLDKYRGFKVALIANIPFFAMSLLMILSKFGLFYNIVIPFKLVNAEIWPLINLIQPSAYLNDYAIWQMLLVVLLPLVPVAVEGVAYIFGINDFSPLAKLIYKKKKPAPKKKAPPTIKSQY